MTKSRSDADDTLAIDGGGNAIGGVLALGAILGSSATEYARDLGAAVRQLFGGGLEGALRAEKELARATVLALAAIADGAITEAERPAIAAYAKRLGVPPEEATAQLMAVVDEVRDPARLRARIGKSAAGLAPSERLELYVAIKNLAHRGSGAWPPNAGYRGGEPSPDALIEVCREALGIELRG